ncbi:unnamed protein product, partial [Iphiclides podalirius]
MEQHRRVRVELWKLIREACRPLHNNTLTGDYFETTPIHQVGAIAVSGKDSSTDSVFHNEWNTFLWVPASRGVATASAGGGCGKNVAGLGVLSSKALHCTAQDVARPLAWNVPLHCTPHSHA